MRDAYKRSDTELSQSEADVSDPLVANHDGSSVPAGNTQVTRPPVQPLLRHFCFLANGNPRRRSRIPGQVMATPKIAAVPIRLFTASTERPVNALPMLQPAVSVPDTHQHATATRRPSSLPSGARQMIGRKE